MFQCLTTFLTKIMKFACIIIDIYVSLRLRVQNRRTKTKSAAQFQHVPYFNTVFNMVFNTPNINIFNTP